MSSSHTSTRASVESKSTARDGAASGDSPPPSPAAPLASTPQGFSLQGGLKHVDACRRGSVLAAGVERWHWPSRQDTAASEEGGELHASAPTLPTVVHNGWVVVRMHGFVGGCCLVWSVLGEQTTPTRGSPTATHVARMGLLGAQRRRSTSRYLYRGLCVCSSDRLLTRHEQVGVQASRVLAAVRTFHAGRNTSRVYSSNAEMIL